MTTKEKENVHCFIPNDKGCLINVVYFKGWQYSKDRSYYEYSPEEKAFDLSRRRRLIRPRKRDLKAMVKQVRGKSTVSDFRLREKECRRMIIG